MLMAFPELVKPYEVFRMKPRVGGGYSARYDRREVQGYWSWRKQTKEDIEGGLNAPDHQATFWVRKRFAAEKAVVSQNDFMEVNGVIFRVVNDQDFSVEGGFYKCLMQRMAGPTDLQVSNTKVADAVRSDY